MGTCHRGIFTEAGITRGVGYFEQPVVQDRVRAERHVARRLVQAREAHGRLEPLPFAVNQGDQRNGRIAGLRRQLRDGIERGLGIRIEHHELLQSSEAFSLVRGDGKCSEHGLTLRIDGWYWLPFHRT